MCTGKLTVEGMIADKSENLTQFGRTMNELGIDLIFARTPQAKGRIERLWVTLQSRLPVELAMRAIKTVSEANEFLIQKYRHLFNQKFSVKAESESLFVPLREGIDIYEILCIKHTRKTDNAGTFAFKNRCFQILDAGFSIIATRKEITVLIHPRYGIRVSYQKRSYDTIRYFKPQRKDSKPKGKIRAETVVTPHLKHSSDAWRKIWWQEDYNQSLKFLYDLSLRSSSLYLNWRQAGKQGQLVVYITLLPCLPEIKIEKPVQKLLTSLFLKIFSFYFYVSIH